MRSVGSKNSLNGELTYGGTLKDGINGTDGLYGTYDIAVSNDGKHVYITSKSMHEISWFDRNVTSGALSYVGKLGMVLQELMVCTMHAAYHFLQMDFMYMLRAHQMMKSACLKETRPVVPSLTLIS